MATTCSSCRLFVSYGGKGGGGECHRFPPTVLGVHADGDVKQARPEVHDDTPACGEHRAKEDEG